MNLIKTLLVLYPSLPGGDREPRPRWVEEMDRLQREVEGDLLMRTMYLGFLLRKTTNNITYEDFLQKRTGGKN
jgi:hypothetical protein